MRSYKLQGVVLQVFALGIVLASAAPVHALWLTNDSDHQVIISIHNAEQRSCVTAYLDPHRSLKYQSKQAHCQGEPLAVHYQVMSHSAEGSCQTEVGQQDHIAFDGKTCAPTDTKPRPAHH